MDMDSEATADEGMDNVEQDAVDQMLPHPAAVIPGGLEAAPVGISESAPASMLQSKGDDDDDAETESEGIEAESDDEAKAAAAAAAVGMPMPMQGMAVIAPPPKPAPNRRSRASSPDADVPMSLDDMRLTARQRARLEKEAGLAEDVQWHEMDMPPELAYTWKGKGLKAPNQMTEEEWLKRQEALERRRLRSLRDKREAEESVKAKIRKAVTAKFRGKLGVGAQQGEASGTEGEGGAAAEQETHIQPGWVKVRHNAAGSSIAWHPGAHELSYPVSVVASSNYPLDPVDVPLQPPAGDGQWQIPESSRASFKLGCMLALQQGSADQQQQTEQQQLWCVDDHGWAVGCLLQQQVIDALEAAGYEPALLQQQHCMQVVQGTVAAGDDVAAAQDGGSAAAAGVVKQEDVGGSDLGCSRDWSSWKAEVTSMRRKPGQQSLMGVVVRLKCFHGQ